MRTVERTAPDATWTIGGDIILPAAPGTLALRIADLLHERRAVIGWLVSETGLRPLIACANPETVRAWMDAEAVQHPDGRVESLVDGRVWSRASDWRESVAH